MASASNYILSLFLRSLELRSPAWPDYVVTEATGSLRFGEAKAWNYQVDALKRFDYDKNEMVDDEGGREKWMSDGKTLYEFDFRAKRLTESTLPNDKQPKGFLASLLFWCAGEWLPWITDAKYIREHSVVKVVTPTSVSGDVWLEISPTDERVKAVFEKLELILDARDDRTKAVQLYDPGGRSRTVYLFSPSPTGTRCQFPVGTPVGWTRVADLPEKK